MSHDPVPVQPSRRRLLQRAFVACALCFAGFDSRAIESTGGIAWIRADGQRDLVDQLMQAIRTSEEHGFNPARYLLPELERQLQALTQSATARRVVGVDPGSTAVASLYRDLDRAFRRLLTDLDRGLIDPATAQNRVFTEPSGNSIDQLYRQVQRGTLSVDDALARVTPSHWHYARLRTALRSLIDQRRQRQAGHHGTSYLVDVQTSGRTTPFVTGKSAGAGSETPALGTDETIARIVQSLERWRWMPHDLGERYLLVNLPNYRVELYNGPQRIIDMAVVIGKANRGTPVFSRDMQYIDFSPTWTVPPRIAEAELLPIERRSPGYLAARGFQLLRQESSGLVLVPDSEMNPQTFSQKPLPYLLRQKPGPLNALGRMKFMLPNPYAIYLHDTPAKHLFAEPTRAFSHGCIRLEDPDRMARLLLQIDGLSLQQVNELLAATVTRRVRLRTPVPTHLAYITTWVDDDGQLQHRPDVYGLDKSLYKALVNSDSLLRNLHKESSA